MTIVYRIYLILILISFGFAVAPFKVNTAFANDIAEPKAEENLNPEQITEGDEALDALFAELKKTSSEEEGRKISAKIWGKWFESGSDSVDLLMDRATIAMNQKKSSVALDILNRVIKLAPDYAEGWNRRATLFYTMGDYSASISDINATLILEPRHFGAISGLGLIMETLGKEAAALKVWYKVVDIYPSNASAQNHIIRLEEKLAGDPT